MKKRRIFKRVFAILSVVLLMSVFAINTFAYDEDFNGYVFDESNVLTYNQYSTYNYLAQGVNVITTPKMGYCAYYAPSSPIQITHRFEEPITLEANNTYVLFWFILQSDSANFRGGDFKVFDGQGHFSRGATQYPMEVRGLGLNGQSFPCYYNMYTPITDVTIYSLGCEYSGQQGTAIVFLPFIVELNDTTTYYFDEGMQLCFYYESNYVAQSAQLSPSQFGTFLTLQNNTVYNFEQGYNQGFAVGFANKQQYGDQMREAGYLDGISFQKSQYSTDLINEYNRGWDVGYDVGKADGLNADGLGLTFKGLFFSVLDAPFDVIRGALNFEFLDINLASFFFSLITLSCFAVLYKRFKG